MSKRNLPSKRMRKWCFTVNNPEMENYTDEMEFAKKWIMQLEMGENETKHLQGVLELENAKTLSALKKIMPRAHLQPCNNWAASIRYCQKAKGRIEGPWQKGIPLDKPLRLISDFRPWQKDVLEILKNEADDRTVHWYWEDQGKVGKTALTKYINAKYNTIVLSGKGNDCFYAISKKKDYNDLVVIFHFPRTVEEYISYSAIESVKDGIFFSGKYESCTVSMNPPHVIIFANFKPDLSALTQDRWHVVHITMDSHPLDEGEEFEEID